MEKIILDTSVLVKLFAPDEKDIIADSLLSLHTQKKLVVKKIGNLLELYVDDVYATKVACNGTTDPTPVYAMIISAGSAVLPQAMNIDDVTLYCSSN